MKHFIALLVLAFAFTAQAADVKERKKVTPDFSQKKKAPAKKAAAKPAPKQTQKPATVPAK